LPSFVAAEALHERVLERVLPSWRLFALTLWAAMPSRKHVPARTRAFVDFLVEVFGGADSDPWLSAAADHASADAVVPPGEVNCASARC
jgi:hypothetical protein